MKLRNGFVSNSSSSSFTCCICGNTESGWDANWEDFGWNCCDQEHVFCCDPLKIDEEKVVEFKKNFLLREIPIYIEQYSSEETLSEFHLKLKKALGDLNKGVLSEEFYEAWEDLTEGATLCELECPVCQFESPNYRDLSRYLLKKFSIPREDIFKIVKEKNKRRRKLYDLEYVTIVCEQLEITVDSLIKDLKKEFKGYGQFLASLRG